jgi:lipid-A-disaccharide synthase
MFLKDKKMTDFLKKKFAQGDEKTQSAEQHSSFLEKRPLRVYLIAGEPSGDLLGSRLMRALKKQEEGRVEFFGVGGETMKQQGLVSLFDIKDLAIMGLLEVVPSIPKVLSLLSKTMKDIEEKKPDVVLTIDSWSFSEQIHKRILKKNLSVPHFHYVAPQAWAWKKGRAKKLGSLMEHVFALLPYEEAFFAPYGAQVTYVGHPVVEGGASKGNRARFLEKHHLNKEDFIVCMLPGSRKTEVAALLPVFMQAAVLLKKRHPSLKIVLPTVDTIAKTVEQAVQKWPVPVLVVYGEEERYDAFSASKGAIAASGTVSLELAMSGTPHLIAYKVSAVTAFLMRRFLKVKYVNLVNILQNEEIVPELLQEKATPEFIVETFEKIIQNEGEIQKNKMALALQKLGAGEVETPSQKAAKKLKQLLKERRQKESFSFEN